MGYVTRLHQSKFRWAPVCPARARTYTLTHDFLDPSPLHEQVLTSDAPADLSRLVSEASPHLNQLASDRSFAADANGMRLHAVKFDRSHRSSSSVGYKIALPILIYDGPILLHRQFRNVPSLTLLR